MNRRQFTLAAVGVVAAPAIARAQDIVKSSQGTRCGW